MEAQRLTCQHCGAPIPLSQLAPTVTCGHCRRQQNVDPGQLAQLQRYRAQMVQQAQAIGQEQQLGQLYDEQRSSGSKATVISIVALGALGAPQLMASNLAGSWQISEALAARLSAGLVGLYFVGGLAYSMRHHLGRPEAVDAGTSQITCPHCGAGLTYRRGQALEQCSHCKASLVATPTIMTEGVDAMRQAHRAAQISRLRKERTTSSELFASNRSSAGMFNTIYAGGGLLLFGGILAYMSYQMAADEDPYHPGIWLAWATWLGAVAASYVWVMRSRRRREAHAESSRALAERLGGRPLDAVPTFVTWLNAYWTVPYDAQKLMAPGLYGGAVGSLDGYPVAVEHSAAKIHQFDRRLQLFVAADLPHLDSASASPAVQGQPHHAWLQQQGYTCRLLACGLIATADEGVEQRLRDDPRRLNELPALLTQAVNLVRVNGGRPVLPLSA